MHALLPTASPRSSSPPPDGATFGPLTLGERQAEVVAPYSYWNLQFHQPEAAYVEFTFGIPRGASVGVYGRKNAIPTLTINDVRDVLTGYRTRERRDVQDSGVS